MSKKNPNSRVAADVVISNAVTYGKFIKKYVGFSRSGTRNTIQDYRDVLIALNNYYTEHILNTGHFVVLPNNLGKLGVKKFKKALVMQEDGTYANRKAMDYGRFKLTGERVYFLNEHTEGHTFAWTWLKPSCRVRDSKAGILFHSHNWRLKPVTRLKEQTATLLKTEGYDWQKFPYTTTKTKYLQRMIQEERAAGIDGPRDRAEKKKRQEAFKECILQQSKN